MTRTASTGSQPAVIQQSLTPHGPSAVITAIWPSSIVQDSQALHASSHPAVTGSHPAVMHPIYKIKENSFDFSSPFAVIAVIRQSSGSHPCFSEFTSTGSQQSSSPRLGFLKV
jgi:hypothetical protein